MALQSHHLEAFLMIARLKNFSKAAESLHVTQSALSHRIAALEDEIAAPLFIREKTGVRLTELRRRIPSLRPVKKLPRGRVSYRVSPIKRVLV